MKFIKAIVILSCIIYSLQIERVENKLESLKRAEKAQTRKAAMKKAEKKISKSLMARIFTVSIFVGNDSLFSVATFDAKDVKVPKNGKARGLYFNFTSGAQIQPSLNALLVPSANGTYLPYRSLAASFVFESPAAQGKYLSTTMQLGQDFKNIKIQFEYDPEWDTITNDELTILVRWLNNLRLLSIDYVNQLKSAASQSAINYYSNKVSYDAALKGAQGIQDQINSTNIHIAAIKANMTINENTIKNIKASISVKEQLLASLSKNQTIAVNTVSQDDQYIASQKSIYSNLQLQKTSNVTDATGFKTTMDLNIDTYDDLVNLVKEEYSDKASVFETSRRAIFVANPPNLDAFNHMINQITPSF